MNVKEITIRRVSGTDAKAIQEITAQGMGYKCDTELVAKKIAGLNAAREAVFVAEVGGNVVGYIHVERYDTLYFESMANLLALSVKEEYQKMGIGKALLRASERWARENGIFMMRVNSGIQRTNAHQFYERMGYSSEKEQKRFVKTLCV